MKKYVIIAGASRGIGKGFLEEFKKQKDVIAIGINRTGSAGVALDLTDKVATSKFVAGLDLSNVRDVVFIHSVGVDKFEPDGLPELDNDGDGIDDEVLATNYIALKNIAEPLIDRVGKENKTLTICTIASVSDIFGVPYWKSFSESKNKVRKFLKSLNRENIKGIVISVGSTVDENGNTYARKGVDTTYWLTIPELLQRSFRILDSFQEIPVDYMEIDIYKRNPLYEKDYFANLSKLYTSWRKDLGYEGKNIPRGLRI